MPDAFDQLWDQVQAPAASQGDAFDQQWDQVKQTKPQEQPWLKQASDAIIRENEQRTAQGIDRLSPAQQIAYQDIFREKAGVQPQHYTRTEEGAIPRDPYTETRAAALKDSAVSNFGANVLSATGEMLGGFTGAGARVADAFTGGNLTEQWAEEMGEARRTLAPQGGVSGFAGQLAGNIANVGLLGGLSPSAGAGGMGSQMLAQAPVAGAFGVSAAGSTATDIAGRRAEGQYIGGGEEALTVAGVAAVETLTEMFGMALLHGAGKAIGPHLPIIGTAIKTGDPKAIGGAVLKALASGGVVPETLKSMAGGALEEAATELGQNIVKKLTYAPEQEVTENVGQAALMGAALPGVMAAPVGLGYMGKTLQKEASPEQDARTPQTAMSRAAAKIGRGVVAMGNEVMGEMAYSLSHTDSGKAFTEGLDNVANRAASLVGGIENQAANAYGQLSKEDRAWLSETDEAGYSNFQRLAEETPSSPVEAPSPAVQGMMDAYTNMLDATGAEAERVGVQAVTPDGEVIDFKRASTGRFLRNLTPDAMHAIQQGHGPLFDAIAQVVARDNGIELSQANDYLSEWLGPKAVRQVGQVEKLRAIKTMPSAVEVGGKRVAIQETDPYLAVMGNARRQAKRIYFIEEFGQNVKGGTTDVEALRAEHQKAGGKVADFDSVLKVFEDRPYKRAFADSRNPIKRALHVLDSLVATAQTSLSVVPNLPQTAILVPKYVGVPRYLKAIGAVIGHPKTTVSQLAAMGAMNRSVMEWTLRPGHGPEDFARVVKGAVSRGTGLEYISQFNNAVSGEAFRSMADTWRNNGIGKKDLAVAKDLRLTPAEVAAVNAGEMTQHIYNKIVQNGVKITQFITEDPHRRSKWQNISWVNGLLAYNNYAIGTAKAVIRMGRETVQALKSNNPKQRIAAAQRLATFLVGAVGAGTVSVALRRAVKGQQPFRDDEDVEDLIRKGLWEVAILGPTQRMQDAFTYSSGSAEKALVGLSPKMSALVSVFNALRGGGRWGKLPAATRAGKTATGLTPIAKAAETWYDKLLHPGVGLYARARGIARAYLPRKEFGGEVKINPHYYKLHQAILRDEDEDIQEAITEFGEWAKEQGWDEDKSIRNLRSSLMSKRPAAMGVAKYREFLNSLTPAKRKMVELAQAHYVAAIDELTLPPEVQGARKGDLDPAREAVAEGKISKGRGRELAKSSKQTELQRQVQGISLDKAIRVWDTANEEERKQIRGLILRKAESAIRRKPAEKDDILKRLDATGIRE